MRRLSRNPLLYAILDAWRSGEFFDERLASASARARPGGATASSLQRLNAEQGELDYLCFETMAEATVSAAQVRARRDPTFPGYDTYLDERMRAVLPGCLKRGTKIISNQGWINPEGAAQRIVHWLRELGARGVKVAAISGGLITDRVLELTDTILENGKPTSTLAGHAGVRRGLPGRGAHRRGAPARREHRGVGPRGRPVDLHGADDVRVRLGSAGPRQAGARQRHRPPDGVRRAGDRRLLRRSRLQGRARSRGTSPSRSPRWRPTAAPSSPRWPAPAGRST